MPTTNGIIHDYAEYVGIKRIRSRLPYAVARRVATTRQGWRHRGGLWRGGGSQGAFGARTGATVLTRATTVLGVLFMVGALVLAIMGQRGPGSVVSGVDAPETAPIETVPAAPASEETPPQ